eukprot:1465053-Prymnesium_polylepis.1
MGTRCEPEHISPSAVGQTVGELSVRLIDAIPMLTCVRTGFDGRTLELLSRAVQPRRGVSKTSTRDQGEQPHGRVH